MATIEKPVTKLTYDMLSSEMIICSGEDHDELANAMANLGPEPEEFHHFRSYTFWKWRNRTVVLSGVGTGCIEPLLYEILDENIVKKIVLVGTAGAMTYNVKMGVSYVVRDAYLAGTGLNQALGVDGRTPLHPNWNFTKEYPTATIASSEFYYGFADPYSYERVKNCYPRRLPQLKILCNEMVSNIDLIDMESAQFYALCRIIPDKRGLEFVSIKGPANTLDNQEEQNLHGQTLLNTAIELAIDILDN